MATHSLTAAPTHLVRLMRHATRDAVDPEPRFRLPGRGFGARVTPPRARAPRTSHRHLRPSRKAGRLFQMRSSRRRSRPPFVAGVGWRSSPTARTGVWACQPQELLGEVQLARQRKAKRARLAPTALHRCEGYERAPLKVLDGSSALFRTAAALASCKTLQHSGFLL